jgi:hypothetical protein
MSEVIASADDPIIDDSVKAEEKPDLTRDEQVAQAKEETKTDVVLTGAEKEDSMTLKALLSAQIVSVDATQIVARHPNGAKVVLANSNPIEALKDLATISGYRISVKEAEK